MCVNTSVGKMASLIPRIYTYLPYLTNSSFMRCCMPLNTEFPSFSNVLKFFTCANNRSIFSTHKMKQNSTKLLDDVKLSGIILCKFKRISPNLGILKLNNNNIRAKTASKKVN